MAKNSSEVLKSTWVARTE